MIWLVGAAAVASVRHSDIDGEAAVERAEKILRRLGVRQNLSLCELVDKDWRSPAPSWRVGFTFDGGSANVVLDAKSGVLVAMGIDEKDTSRVRSNEPLTAGELRRMQEVLRILGYGKGIRTGNDVGFTDNGPYYVLVHGLPFFNLNPTYGPNLSMNGTTGRPSIFYGCPPLPPVSAWRPVVTPDEAVLKIRTWGHARAVARGLTKAVDPSEGDLIAELGYWKLKDEAEARLVWRATKYTKIYGKQYGLGCLRVFVDALTGEFVEPDDPAWGANP